MKLPTPLPLRAAETDFVWVIVPLSRPENLNAVLCNFNRQKFPFKKLVLVENGRALGVTRGFVALEKSAMILSSDAHQSSAKNTALHEIRKRGGGFTVVMDDDDWYGPQYLTEACGYARTYEVIGKSRHFVSANGNLWLCSREQRGRETAPLAGSTIACWAENAPEYPHVSYGEESDFCLAALRKGMRIFGTDIYHYLYRRGATGHTWKIDLERLRQYESDCGALDLGAENLSVITGDVLEVDGKRLLPTEETDTLLPPPPGVAHVST